MLRLDTSLQKRKATPQVAFVFVVVSFSASGCPASGPRLFASFHRRCRLRRSGAGIGLLPDLLVVVRGIAIRVEARRGLIRRAGPIENVGRGTPLGLCLCAPLYVSSCR